MSIRTTGNSRIDTATAEIAVAVRGQHLAWDEQQCYDEAMRLRDEILAGSGESLTCGDCGDALADRPGADGNMTHLADGSRACRSRDEANARRDWQGRPRIGQRPISAIASEIISDWAAPGRTPYFGAVPYIEAMRHLNGIGGRYGQESADDIVRYFLASAKTWRGETARRIKTELRGMLA